ncbi:MAG TPA: zinc ABC transporter substrate-binding protein [Terriglobales bacterium]|nr:zinc ABC transporter substrate-binding protein [Terriglobales bacterium]
MRQIYEAQRWSTLLLVLALASVAANPVLAQTTSKLRIVASTADLAAIAAEVGGERAEVQCLVRGNQDPHFVQAKPSYLLKLRRADLLIILGLELESGWLTRPHHTPSLLSQSGNPRIQPGASGYFDASQYAEILETPNPPLTPSIQPFGNPHYWLDPENGRRIAQALAHKMSEMRPGSASYFDQQFRAFSDRLSGAEQRWDAKMKPYRGRKVVTYSRSWSNFLKHFQLVSEGEIEPQPGIPPSLAHTRELIPLMKSEGAKVILVEPYFELSSPHAIARETGAEVVVMPSSVGGEKRAGDYFQLFDYDVALLADAFHSKGEGPGMGTDRDFMFLILSDSAKVQAMTQPCLQKRVRQELRTLCREMLDVRAQEDQILMGWLASWFQASAPSGGQTALPLGLASADGAQFESIFLKLVTQQDEEEIRTFHGCMEKSSHRELVSLCVMLTRARSIEIQLMRSQLCLWHDDRKPHNSHDNNPVLLQTTVPKSSGASQLFDYDLTLLTKAFHPKS